MPGVEETTLNAVRDIVSRRDDVDIGVAATSDFFDDLMLDSLELAELSALLEDEYGTDPYSEGLAPRTVAEVAAFYGTRERA